MARKTLIRNERPHEVKLGDGDHLAQSHKVDAQEVTPIPPAIRKPAAGRASAQKAAPLPAAAAPSAPSRKKAAAGHTETATAPPARKRASRPASTPSKTEAPKLPARVPADRLWEDDSAVMQRLNALLQQNARLAEQLQRIQHPAHPKGFQP